MNAQTETGIAYPASWWESQTAEQLQEFIRRGFMSGELFDGAQRELERRARESLRNLDEAAEQEIKHRVDERNWVALAAAAVSVLLATCALVWQLIIR